MIPKVKFELARLKYETDMLYVFCKPLKTNWDWSEKVFHIHPSLKEKLVKIKLRKRSLEIIKCYTKKFWQEEFEQLKNQRVLFQREWDKINDKYMVVLSKVLETNFPKNRKIIYAQISIIPICPRFLKNWAFSIFYLSRAGFMRETVAHEVLHFLYFKKWKEVFLDAKEKTFDIPYLEWSLSEILAPVILNDERIQKIIKYRARGYLEHENIKMGKRTLMQHFEDLYNRSKSNKESFAQFLEIAYKEAQKYKDKILKT